MNSVGLIWDIDGLVVDSPHEEAWRITAMKEPWNVKEFSSDFYFSYVASRPRYEGANNILDLKGVYKRLGAKTEEEKKELLEKYCEQKNRLIRELISSGKFRLFPDAVTLLLKSKKTGILQAAASASKNAKDMLIRVSKSRIIKEVGGDYGVLKEKDNLYSMFDVDACGLDLGGKKNILKFAGEKLNALSAGKIKRMIVFEDAPTGVKAAKSLGYYAIGVLRIGNKKALKEAGADIVSEDLRTIRVKDLLQMNK